MANKLGNLTLWINSFKKEDNHPDYKGKADLNGKRVNVSLWINRDIAGVPIHLSGQFSEPHSGDDPVRENGGQDELPYRGKNPSTSDDDPFGVG